MLLYKWQLWDAIVGRPAYRRAAAGEGEGGAVLDKNLFALPGARRMLGALCLITLLKAAAVMGQAWTLATAVDLLRAGSALVDAAFSLAGFLICFMGRQAIAFFQDGMLERYAGDRVAELRVGLLRRVFAEGPLFVGAMGTGNTVALALEGAEQVDNYLRLVLPKIAGVVIVPLVLLAFAFPFDWVSGLIMLIVFPFIIFYMVLLGKTAKAEADKQHDEFNRLANHFVDTLRGIDTLKLFGRSAAQGQSVFAASERLRQATMKTLRTAILSGAVLDLFATFSVAAVAIMLGFRLVDGSIAFFPALLMLILVPEYFKPIREYASDYHASLDGKTALEALLKVAAPSDALEAAGAPALRPAGSGATRRARGRSFRPRAAPRSTRRSDRKRSRRSPRLCPSLCKAQVTRERIFRLGRLLPSSRRAMWRSTMRIIGRFRTFRSRFGGSRRSRSLG